MSIFQTGLGALDEGNGSSDRVEFLSLKDGETADFAFLSSLSGENFVSYYQHFHQENGKTASGICLRRDGACVFCEHDIRASRRFAVPVLVSHRYKVVKGKRVGVETIDAPMIWAFGPTVLTSLKALMNRHEKLADGDTAGQAFTITRQGTGLATTYALTFENESVDVSGVAVPNVRDYVGPLTYTDQVAMLNNMGMFMSGGAVEDSQIVTALYGEPSRPEHPAKPAKPAKAASPAKAAGDGAASRWGSLVDDDDADEVPF